MRTTYNHSTRSLPQSPLLPPYAPSYTDFPPIAYPLTHCDPFSPLNSRLFIHPSPAQSNHWFKWITQFIYPRSPIPHLTIYPRLHVHLPPKPHPNPFIYEKSIPLLSLHCRLYNPTPTTHHSSYIISIRQPSLEMNAHPPCLIYFHSSYLSHYGIPNPHL